MRCQESLLSILPAALQLVGALVTPPRPHLCTYWCCCCQCCCCWVLPSTTAARTRMLLTDFINNGQNPGIAGLWRTADGGATWSLRQQADWGADIFFDHRNPQRAYAGGGRSISPWGLSTAGGWGYGGFFYSDDAGGLTGVEVGKGAVIPAGMRMPWQCGRWWACLTRTLQQKHVRLCGLPQNSGCLMTMEHIMAIVARISDACCSAFTCHGRTNTSHWVCVLPPQERPGQQMSPSPSRPPPTASQDMAQIPARCGTPLQALACCWAQHPQELLAADEELGAPVMSDEDEIEEKLQLSCLALG